MQSNTYLISIAPRLVAEETFLAKELQTIYTNLLRLEFPDLPINPEIS